MISIKWIIKLGVGLNKYLVDLVFIWIINYFNTRFINLWIVGCNRRSDFVKRWIINDRPAYPVSRPYKTSACSQVKPTCASQVLLVEGRCGRRETGSASTRFTRRPLRPGSSSSFALPWKLNIQIYILNVWSSKWFETLDFYYYYFGYFISCPNLQANFLCYFRAA